VSSPDSFLLSSTGPSQASSHAQSPHRSNTRALVSQPVAEQRMNEEQQGGVSQPSWRMLTRPRSNQSISPINRNSQVSSVLEQAVSLLEDIELNDIQGQPESSRGKGKQREIPTNIGASEDSRILRKTNSGFEVLKPGSFSRDSTRQSSVDSTNTGSPPNSSGPKKLQKRSRPTSASSSAAAESTKKGPTFWDPFPDDEDEDDKRTVP
jgi:hypothetical protein